MEQVGGGRAAIERCKKWAQHVDFMCVYTKRVQCNPIKEPKSIHSLTHKNTLYIIVLLMQVDQGRCSVFQHLSYDVRTSHKESIWYALSWRKTILLDTYNKLCLWMIFMLSHIILNWNHKRMSKSFSFLVLSRSATLKTELWLLNNLLFRFLCFVNDETCELSYRAALMIKYTYSKWSNWIVTLHDCLYITCVCGFLPHLQLHRHGLLVAECLWYECDFI